MGIFNGTSASDILIGSMKSDTINGFGGNDTLRGWDGNDQLNGGDGDDLLDGGLGADTMNGGFGHDRYIIDNDGDIVVDVDLSFGEIFISGGNDTVVSSISYILSETLENLELSGGKFNDINGTGNARDNVLAGNRANNVLAGLGGDDIINGGDGDDLLDGGDGFDTVSYLTATAGVMIDLRSHGLSEQHTGGGGNDALVSIEHVIGSNYDDELGSSYPSEGGFTFDGGAGNDSIMGGSGVGGIWTNPNVLNGGTGDDRIQGGEAITNFLNGGAGADTISFWNSSFNIVQYQSVDDSPAGAGRDTIVHSWSEDNLIAGLIDLREIDANTLESGNQAFVWNGPFTAGHLRYTGNVLQGNTDADAAAEFEIAMVLYGGDPLTPAGAGLDVIL